MNAFRTLVIACVAGAQVSACASIESQMRGSSGPMTWEIVDVRQTVTPDQREVRWDYTLVLKETTGRQLRFERVERIVRSRGGVNQLQGRSEEIAFQRLVEPHGELRLNLNEGLVTIGPWNPGFGQAYTPGGLEGMTIFYRFHGQDDSGQPTMVEVKVPLGPNVGKRVRSGE